MTPALATDATHATHTMDLRRCLENRVSGTYMVMPKTQEATLDKVFRLASNGQRVHLLPRDYYNSGDFQVLFEGLLRRSDMSEHVVLNLPWARPGSWVGLTRRAELLEELVRQQYCVTSFPVW